ncbi:MAG: M23 family metallopeptidase [Phenylobacterium sp.]|uniref:M23 family metallopeptidase n=1 Tax=Phenylobacterium sp. TaxID=1871053 RepID=UPI00271EEE1B|nr:M23 family metallopeptidase [Phenylobacterium sp.]MDO9430063.1 M23 family metallopeptidase [Phenylobacterium sp.]
MKFAPLVLASLISGCAPAGDTSAQAVKAASPPANAPQGAVALAGPRLAFPVACDIGKTCEVQNFVDRDPGPSAKDYRCGSQTYQDHGGVDIRLHDMAAQAAGVNVLAAAPGRVSRLRDGVADISVKSPDAPPLAGQDCGNGVVIDHGDGWETQYCHLARGSVMVKQGDQVVSGQPIARVGLSGNTEYPHLHLTVRKAGVMVDPFAPDMAAGACAVGAAGDGLWTPGAAKAMGYKQGAVLNAGFAAAPLTMEAIEGGRIGAPTRQSPMLIAYVRAINLQGGDVQKLVIKSPDGSVLTNATQPALDRAKAQYMFFTGKRAPEAGWKPGTYSATYSVEREGKAVITQAFSINF